MVQLSGARTSLEQLVSQNPEEVRFQAALAECCEQLARVYHDLGQSEAARRVSNQAIEIRNRIAGKGGIDATARINQLAAHYSLPHDAATLRAIPQLSQEVIDDWPREAAAMYEAACRLTFNVPVLTQSHLAAKEP
jgi:hypothetical protein